jgi:uracil-DNA glycosylase
MSRSPTAEPAPAPGTSASLILAGRPVSPEGPDQAPLYLVGEAPGKAEAEAGRPFVGRAGEALREMMREAGLDPARVRLANAIPLRPVERSASGRLRNRRPTRAELQAHGQAVLRDIGEARPALIGALGRSAALLFGIDQPVEEARRQDRRWGAIPVRVTCHPSYVLRFGGPGSALWQRTVADLRQFWAEAQRGGTNPAAG